MKAGKRRNKIIPSNRVGKVLSWIVTKIGWRIILIVLGIIFVGTFGYWGRVLPGESRLRVVEFMRWVGVPPVLIPTGPEDIRLFVDIQPRGYGFLALAFHQVASAGRTQVVVEPSDLRDVRVCQAHTVVGATEEEALVKLVGRYPRCFSHPEVTHETIRVRAAPGAPLARTTDGTTEAIWCDCPTEVMARAGHKERSRVVPGGR
jgi:hypothetical protein